MQNPKIRKLVSIFILGLLPFFIQKCAKNNSSPDVNKLILGLTANQIAQGIPGEAVNEAPLLNDLDIQTSLVNGSQLITVKFSFQNSSLQNYSIKAYLGRPGTIVLKSDGITVEKYVQEASEVSAFPKQIRFSPPETGASYKIIVVAKNSFGVSVKQGSSKPPVVAGACGNALNAGTVADPLVIGNCNEYCMKVSLDGNDMQMKVEYNAGATSYFYMDLFAWKSDGNIATYNYTELFPDDPSIPIPPGQKVAEISINTSTFTEACVSLDSFSIFQENPDTPVYKYLNTRVIVP